jgi:hypothetical protein
MPQSEEIPRPVDTGGRLPAARGARSSVCRPGTISCCGASAGADLHRFFAAWVSGRGHYPALRVGRQPYGIMVTNALKSWASAPAGAPFTASALLGGACA